MEDQKKLLKRETDSQMMLSDIVNPVDDNFRAKTSEIDSALPDIYQRVTKTEEEIISIKSHILGAHPMSLPNLIPSLNGILTERTKPTLDHLLSYG